MMSMEKKEIAMKFEELEEVLSSALYEVLEFSRSERITREMFERCMVKAQQRYTAVHG